MLNRTAKIYPKILNSTMNRHDFNAVILDESLGPIQEHLALALAIAWILVFFGVFKGIGSMGWAVTITATLPYLLVSD